MSWAAMSFVRRLKRDSGIVGNVRLVALMIALRIPKGHTESKPIPLRWLVKDTCLDRKTVRDCIKKACKSGYLKVGQQGRGRGNFTTYVMPNLAGPLFMVDGDDDGKGGDSPPFTTGIKGGEPPPFQPPRKGGDSHPFAAEKGEIRPKPVRTSTSKDVRTKRSTTAEKPAAEIYTNALAFLDWFAASYPSYNDGAKVSIDIEADGPVIVRLLTSPERTVDRLQAMAVAMWTVTAGEDPWAHRAADRGIRLFNHIADRMERVVLKRERCALDEQAAAASKPDAGRDRAAAVARAVAVLEGQTNAALVGLCRQTADRLRAGETDVHALDAELVAAARRIADLKAFDADARRSLAGFQSRVSSPTFETLVANQVTERVREYAQLPDLLAIASVFGAGRAATAG